LGVFVGWDGFQGIQQIGRGGSISNHGLTANFASVSTARIGAGLLLGEGSGGGGGGGEGGGGGDSEVIVRVDKVGEKHVALGVCKGDYKLDRLADKRGAFTLLSNGSTAKNGTLSKSNHGEWAEGDVIRLRFGMAEQGTTGTLAWWRNGTEEAPISGVKCEPGNMHFCIGGGAGAQLTLVPPPTN
jgi:hypothetical protein